MKVTEQKVRSLYHSTVFLGLVSAFFHIFSFFWVCLCRHFVCLLRVSRPRTQILSLFILAAILNKFPLSVLTNQSRDFCCVPGSFLLPPPYWKARRPWGRGWTADMQFTKEIEENGKIPFLVCLVILDNNRLRTTIYGKPTQFTDRLLDQSSYNPTSHKATTIRTLRRRAQLVCDSPDDLNNACSRNNNSDFVRRNTHSNT